jgi:hypothetical protein
MEVMMENTLDEVRKLLHGGYDLHNPPPLNNIISFLSLAALPPL